MASILGIESTCDETAVAIVVDGHDVRSNTVASQVELHAKYRGVVPEIASRAHIENILPVLDEALTCNASHSPNEGGQGEASVPLAIAPSSCLTFPHPGLLAGGDGTSGIDAVAVAYRPGLIGSLLVGVTAAKTLAWSIGKPLIGVDHVHAHLYSVVLDRNEQPPMPAVGLVVSGGHTAIYSVQSWLEIKLIGSTIDDAIGEAYDKVAALLGLGYPGGPILDKLAERGDPAAIRFPRTLLDSDSLDFSFSGLKTAVLYHVHGVPARGKRIDTTQIPEIPEQHLCDIAAGFQAACIDVVTKKLKRAIAKTGARSVIIGGGVAANRGLRAALAQFQVPVYFPSPKYCTDNAAMIAGLASLYFDAGLFKSLDLDAITHSIFREP